MDKYKILGREYLTTSATGSVIYKVPLPTDFDAPGTEPRTDATVLYTIISSLVVCNQSSSDGTFSVAVRDDDSTGVASVDYVFNETPISANNTMIINPGITLPAEPKGTNLSDGADVTVYAIAGNISFHLYGVEVTR